MLSKGDIKMSRYNIVNEFNFYTRKRDSYDAKIQKHNALKIILEDALTNCNTYMKELEFYDDEATIFQQLYHKNYLHFNTTENIKLLNILNAVGEHLSSERDNAQKQINYWYSQLQAYDEEQKEEEA